LCAGRRGLARDVSLDYGRASVAKGCELAEIARPQMPHAEQQVANLGALQSMEFKGVGPGGADIYRLKFEHGLIEWRIFLDADGKIATQFWHPVPE